MTDFTEFHRSWQAVREQAATVAGRISTLTQEHERLGREAEDAGALAADWARAADVLRSFSDEQSAKLRTDIERLTTTGLRAVFADDTLTFKVTTRVLRGNTSVEFTLVSVMEGREVELPVLGARGGGVAEVIGFVLRVVVALLSDHDPILILDEPFSHVSANYRPALAQFIRELIDSTPLQLILVTHDDVLPETADMHYVFSTTDGITTAQED
jgi:DNA repair exonuclease SbcCD ATPase subunit